MSGRRGSSRRAVAVAVAGLGVAGCGGRSPAEPSATTVGTFPSGDIRLAYTLDLPPGPGPSPAFVLGHGSGRSTRNEAVSLAARLTAAGFAVLRYDKRGVGSSTGVYEGVGVFNSDRVIGLLADDMAAGVAFLGTQPAVDAQHVGLIGASQAGWIMPVAAARSGRVRFMVLLVGPTVSVGEEIYYSQLAEGSALSFDELSRRLAEFTGPRGYDPRPHLENLSVPGFWVLGGQDRSIPTRETVAILQALQAAGRPYRWVVHENATHGLVDAQTRAPVDFMPDVLAFLAPYR